MADCREKLSTLNDNMKKRKPESFAHLLDPAGTLTETGPSHYDPYYLDHPDLKSGKHRTVISLPCFMGSIIQYTKPTDLKKELNEQFRETHPNIDSSLKLSHIRSLKRKLLNIIQQEDLEISSLAKSYAYLEKLIIKGLVNKSNRKLYAGVCLFLATKVNEPKGMNFGALLDAIYKHLSITPKEIKDQEFTVFASLDFSLYLPRSEFLPHFERIFALLDYKNINEYLGDNPFFLTKT
ncbi:hypothetical protein BKA69DRAFT_1035450 [Paraphysoderma sedebokerense]|nr:hypothetical protein BKA69DRAFT_1035450 [Paraphysoderma sedebokerense]